MKIIKAGNKNRLLQIKRFQCQRCGCIFEATKDEYYSDQQYNDIYYFCQCPCCRNRNAQEVIMRGI